MVADLAAGLRSGLDELGLVLDDATALRLLGHLQLIAKWNKVYNLTAVRDPAEMLTHHLLDCLAVVAPLRRYLAQAEVVEPVEILDVGSGSGLPGVSLATINPAWQVTCVDTVAKKAMFIRQVGAELGLPNLRAEHARVENLAAKPWQVITSRAFASLVDFVNLTRELLAPGGVWTAMKGKVPDDEIAALPADVEVFHVEHLNVPGLDAQRCLVWMRHKPN